MKTILIIFIAIIGMIMPINAQNVIQEGNIFKEKVESKSQETKTEYYWEDRKGEKYPIYISQRGSCYIKKVSKKGKEYKQYLGKEVSEKICKLMNIQK